MAFTKPSTHTKRVRFKDSDTSDGAIADRDTTDAETDWTDCETFQPSYSDTPYFVRRSGTPQAERPESSIATGRGSGKRQVRTSSIWLNDSAGLPNPKRQRDISDTSEIDEHTGPRFACPFYKHDPQQYKTHRTCPGPGWPTVHRVKEHLYRRHSKTGDSGISMEQKEQLKRRLAPGQTEAERWGEVYRIVFPDEAVIPSPYLDGPEQPTPSSFQQELLQRIRSELLHSADQSNAEAEDRVMRQVADIIKKCEAEMRDQPMLPVQRSLHLSTESESSQSLLYSTSTESNNAMSDLETDQPDSKPISVGPSNLLCLDQEMASDVAPHYSAEFRAVEMGVDQDEWLQYLNVD